MSKRRQLFSNSFSILINRIAQSATAFVLFAAIARIRGPYELGQYTLALSYYFIFMTVASQGFKMLITRELARHPDETPLYLGNGTLLQLVACLASYTTLVLVVSLFPYQSDTALVCMVVGLAIIPFSLSNVTEAIFQGSEKMYLVAASTVPIYILRLGINFVLLKLGYGIIVVAWIQVMSEFVILAVEWALVTRHVKPIWRMNRTFMWRTMNSARSFVAIEGLAILQTRIQALILSLVAGEIVVGLYGAITQLLQPFQIITLSIITAIFPRLSKSAHTGVEHQRQLTQTVIEVLLLVALPLAIALYFIGGDLLVFLYRNTGFAMAEGALKILSLVLVATAFIRPLSYLLVANNLERVNVREVIVTTMISTIVSIPLIANYGLVGAALATLLTSLLALAQYSYAVYRLVFKLSIWEIARRPLLVSVLITTIFAVFVH